MVGFPNLGLYKPMTMSIIKVSLFAQLLSLVDRNVFHKIVTLHNSDKSCKGFNTWTHFVSMLFMQFSGFDSVRDISNGLRSATGNLSHFGVSGLRVNPV